MYSSGSNPITRPVSDEVKMMLLQVDQSYIKRQQEIVKGFTQKISFFNEYNNNNLEGVFKDEMEDEMEEEEEEDIEDVIEDEAVGSGDKKSFMENLADNAKIFKGMGKKEKKEKKPKKEKIIIEKIDGDKKEKKPKKEKVIKPVEGGAKKEKKKKMTKKEVNSIFDSVIDKIDKKIGSGFGQRKYIKKDSMMGCGDVSLDNHPNTSGMTSTGPSGPIYRGGDMVGVKQPIPASGSVLSKGAQKAEFKDLMNSIKEVKELKK